MTSSTVVISEERNLWKSFIHRLAWKFTHARKIRTHHNLRAERILQYILVVRLRNSRKTLHIESHE